MRTPIYKYFGFDEEITDPREKIILKVHLQEEAAAREGFEGMKRVMTKMPWLRPKS